MGSWLILIQPSSLTSYLTYVRVSASRRSTWVEFKVPVDDHRYNIITLNNCCVKPDGGSRAHLRSSSLKEIQNIEEELPTSVFEFVDEDACIPPVFIGKQSKLKLCNKPIQVEDMVLLDILKYAGDWPQLGQVFEMLDSKIKIKWYKGSMSGSWSPCTLRATGERGKRAVWTEDVSPAQIWCWVFNLTPSGYLPKRIEEKVEEHDA